jgi:hypothetical protein
MILLLLRHKESILATTGEGTQKREEENPRGVRRRQMTTDDDFGDGDEKRMRSVDVNFPPPVPHPRCLWMKTEAFPFFFLCIFFTFFVPPFFFAAYPSRLLVSSPVFLKLKLKFPYLFIHVDVNFFAKFNPKTFSKIPRIYTRKTKKIVKFSQFLCQKIGQFSPQKKIG